VSELLDLFVRLVETASPSKSERAAADLVLAYLREAGLDPVEDDSGVRTDSDAGNIHVVVEGRGEGVPILVGAHLDTVAVDGPISAVVADGVVRSEGETILGADDKCACAILLLLLRDLAREAPPGRVEAVFTTCEEIGLRGAKAFDLAPVRARAGFVFDSSGPLGDVITAAPSAKTLVAEFHGVAAHAGIAPEAGRSAIAAAGRAIALMDLGRIDEMTTANIGVIEGGVAINIVPEWCTVRGEARSRDEARLATQVGRMLDAFTLGANEVGVDVTTTVIDEYRAFSLPPDTLPAQLAREALRQSGIEPRLTATGGGSDVNIFNEKGLPSVNLSVGMEKVHTHDEYIPVDRLEQAYKVLRALVRVAGAASV
jgi:tripeptide aminopeptidase